MPSRKIKKKSYKKLTKSLRLTFFLLLTLLYFYWSKEEFITPNFPQSGEKAQLFANQCDDELCPLFLSAIKEAKQSILLIVYTLSDSKLITALNEKAEEGIPVKLIVDASSPSCKGKKMKGIHQIPRTLSGLMHRKILVVDEEKVFIGSANFTLDSLHLDDNLFAAFSSQELAYGIARMEESHPLIGGQRIDFYPLPEKKEIALEHLLYLLDDTRESLHIAMFTLTHPELVEKVISAHQRGILVEVVVDRKSAEGASKQSVEKLVKAGVPLSLHLGNHTFHHKLAVFDEKKVAFGSVNWTRAGFSKNEECLLIIEEMGEEQIEKLKQLWHAIQCTSKRVKRCSRPISLSLIYEVNPKNSLPKIIPIIPADSPSCCLASLSGF